MRTHPRSPRARAEAGEAGYRPDTMRIGRPCWDCAGNGEGKQSTKPGTLDERFLGLVSWLPSRGHQSQQGACRKRRP